MTSRIFIEQPFDPQNETYPIEAITPAGVRQGGHVYAVDDIVFAAGFDAMTAPRPSASARRKCARAARRIVERRFVIDIVEDARRARACAGNAAGEGRRIRHRRRGRRPAWLASSRTGYRSDYRAACNFSCSLIFDDAAGEGRSIRPPPVSSGMPSLRS